MDRPWSGKAEKLPYSFSRYTDLPAHKWEWFSRRLDAGWFFGVDPRNSLPSKWSLTPEDTLGLIFWTREPTNLIRHQELLKPFQSVIHMTATGWSEVEAGAPTLEQSVVLMRQLVAAFGVENVVWRFSPIPIVEDVLERFVKLAKAVEELGGKEVFTTFLQDNDHMVEPRTKVQRQELLKQMAAETSLRVLLCNEDSVILDPSGPSHLARGICEDGQRFAAGFEGRLETDTCGCALAIDPFTINESCCFRCSYCYAAHQATSPKKRNTTKSQRKLPVIGKSR